MVRIRVKASVTKGSKVQNIFFDNLFFDFCSNINTHCLGMSYYVNFFGGIGSNEFHIK